MRYLPLTDADRREMLAVIGASSIDELFRDVPEAARLAAKIAGLPTTWASSRSSAPSRPMRRRTWSPATRRSSSAAAPTAIMSRERRPHHPARRVPDQLHALPARDRAGHAADAVRVPDPGRAAVRLRGRQRLDVRRLDRAVGSDPDGAPHHAPEQGDDLRRAAPALSSASSRRWRSSPATGFETRVAGNGRRRRTRGPDRRRSTSETSCVVVQISRHPSAGSPTSRRSPRPRTPRARC